MNRLLLDTSYLVAHFNQRDAHHTAAKTIADRFMAGEWDQLVLTDMVFAETISVLMNRATYAGAKKVGEVLRNGDEIHWVKTGELMNAAWHEFLAQPDEKLSFVDSIILATSDRLGVPQIATFDGGFESIPRVECLPPN